MKEIIRKYILLLCGIVLASIAIQWFYQPHEIVNGGITGLAIVFTTFGINKGIFLFVCNLVLTILAWFLVGKKFALNSVIGGLVLFPIVLGVIPEYNLTEDTLLAVIVAGGLVGCSIALCYFADASTGGTMLLAAVVNKHLRIKYPIALAIFDGIVIIVGSIVFGVEKALYAIITLVIATVVADAIESGFSRVKIVYIISQKNDEIKIALMDEVKRGVTVLHGHGAYSKQEQKILMCAISVRQLKGVQKLIGTVDPKAFFFTTNATSTFGNGFDDLFYKSLE
ncbi:MAG: YitT family protein [Mycoplasmatales bacterium]